MDISTSRDTYADDRAKVLDMYRLHKGNDHTPEQALACVAGGMLALILDFEAAGQPIPHGLLVMLGEIGRLWGMAHRGEPLPEDWL